MYLTVALALTLLVLLFARDINRSAHGAIGPRRSENRSFGQMVSLLVAQENNVDARLYYLLQHGGSLSRSVFAARLDQLAQQLPGWATEAELLRRPVLAHHVNDLVFVLTEQRIDDYQNLFSDLTSRLGLPWSPTPTGSQVVTEPAQSLVATVTQWDHARWSLTHEPGRVTLPYLSMGAAKYYVAVGTNQLTNSTSLAPTRAIGIVAVEVTPTPLPAPTGVLLLPPVTSIQLGVTVSNVAYIQQPVTLRVVFTPSFGPARSETLHTVLGPLQSYAFVPGALATVASERATLTITVTGAPPGPGLGNSRTYQVKISPSGN